MMENKLNHLEELDIAVGLIIESYGKELDRITFESVSRDLVPLQGHRDRLWARYLLACDLRGRAKP